MPPPVFEDILQFDMFPIIVSIAAKISLIVLGVKHPNRVIEIRGEAHPENVRYQKPHRGR